MTGRIYVCKFISDFLSLTHRQTDTQTDRHVHVCIVCDVHMCAQYALE